MLRQKQGPAAESKPRARAGLQNGELVSGRGARLITPDPTAMAAITAQTAGRAVYFPLPNREAFQTVGRYGVGEPEFFDFITAPLCERVSAEWPGRQLAMRGVLCSIDGIRPGAAPDPGGGDLLTPQEIIRRGIERPDPSFRVSALRPEYPLSVDRVNRYASYARGYRDRAKTQADADAMFPAVLVYDCADLESAPDSRYKVRFRKEVNPSEALLRVCVLDCPATPYMLRFGAISSV
jgi:hypothetical protein